MNQEIKLNDFATLFAEKKVFLVCGESFNRLSIKEYIEVACIGAVHIT